MRASRISPHSLIVAMRFPFLKKHKILERPKIGTCKYWWLRVATQASARKG
jgi:hypothetical protein